MKKGQKKNGCFVARDKDITPFKCLGHLTVQWEMPEIVWNENGICIFAIQSLVVYNCYLLLWLHVFVGYGE